MSGCKYCIGKSDHIRLSHDSADHICGVCSQSGHPPWNHCKKCKSLEHSTLDHPIEPKTILKRPTGCFEDKAEIPSVVKVAVKPTTSTRTWASIVKAPVHTIESKSFSDVPYTESGLSLNTDKPSEEVKLPYTIDTPRLAQSDLLRASCSCSYGYIWDGSEIKQCRNCTPQQCIDREAATIDSYFLRAYGAT